MYHIDEKLRILKPVVGNRKTQRLRQMYFHEDDFRQKKEIENYIDLLIARHVRTTIDDEIVLPPPERSLCSGDMNLGDVEYINKKLLSI